MIRLIFVTERDASPFLYIHRAERAEILAALESIAPRPVTPERAAVALIRATQWDIEPVSTPVTELTGLLDFIDDGRSADVIAFDPQAWQEYDLRELLKDHEPDSGDNNPFDPDSPEGRAWENGDRSSIESR
jgi:hypothetical protein